MTTIAGQIDGTGGILAQVLYWYRGTEVLECDVVVDVRENWGTGVDRMHLPTVMTHGCGHVWRLGDLYSDAARFETMYGYIRSGHVDMDLYCGDLRGMRLLYGLKSAALSTSVEDGTLGLPPRPQVLISGLE
jgi:hypothetical protein